MFCGAELVRTLSERGTEGIVCQTFPFVVTVIAC